MGDMGDMGVVLQRSASTSQYNLILAKKTLESLLKRLRHNSALLKQYSDIINEQLKNNIAEKVNDNLPTIGKHITYSISQSLEKTIEHRN